MLRWVRTKHLIINFDVIRNRKQLKVSVLLKGFADVVGSFVGQSHLWKRTMRRATEIQEKNRSTILLSNCRWWCRWIARCTESYRTRCWWCCWLFATECCEQLASAPARWSASSRWGTSSCCRPKLCCRWTDPRGSNTVESCRKRAWTCWEESERNLVRSSRRL